MNSGVLAINKKQKYGIFRKMNIISLDIIVLSKTSHTQRDKYFMVFFS